MIKFFDTVLGVVEQGYNNGILLYLNHNTAGLHLGPVHPMLDNFENATLFLWLGLLSTLIGINCPPKMELFENALQSE